MKYALIEPCMFDRNGQRVEVWLPEMQSTEFLRASIARGERTAECWTALRANRSRVHAARAVLARLREDSTTDEPALLRQKGKLSRPES
jgi:hypothetical protein